MLDEVKQVKDTAVERVFKSTFFGSWVIAFSILNWRAIYILLFPSGDLAFLDRLNFVDANLYNDWWEWLFFLMLLPLGYACLNMAYLPRFIHWLEEKRATAEVRHENAITNIHGGRLVEQMLLSDAKAQRDNLKKQTEELQEEVKKWKEMHGEALMYFVHSIPQFQMNLNALAKSAPVHIPESALFNIEAVGLATRVFGKENTWQVTPLGLDIARRVQALAS